jgi:hypothetical protein
MDRPARRDYERSSGELIEVIEKPAVVADAVSRLLTKDAHT